METIRQNQTARPKKSKKKRIVLWVILGILALALIGGGVYVWHILKRPDLFFDSSVHVNAIQTPEVTPAFEIDAYLPTDRRDSVNRQTGRSTDDGHCQHCAVRDRRL